LKDTATGLDGVFVEAQAITRFRVNFHREDGCRGDQLVHGYLKLTNTGGAWREWQQNGGPGKKSGAVERDDLGQRTWGILSDPCHPLSPLLFVSKHALATYNLIACMCHATVLVELDLLANGATPPFFHLSRTKICMHDIGIHQFVLYALSVHL
jgi:hypothetical protein